MNLPVSLLASGMLYGAWIGMAIATILVIAVPSWRKAILDNYKQGSKVGRQFGDKVVGNEAPDAQADAVPVKRYAACPDCGSKKFTAAESKTPWADSGFFSLYLANDRCCKECGRVYPMLFPAWARWLFMAMGVPIAIFGVALFFAEGEAMVPLMCILVGGFIFAMGFCLPRH